MNRLVNRLERLEVQLKRNNPNQSDRYRERQYQSNFYNRSQDVRNSSQAHRYPRTEDGRVICRNCREPGHFERFCPKPMRPQPQGTPVAPRRVEQGNETDRL
ncbi:hypothetical protein B4U80_11687 [Leptotrombidium deliense]|uniref:CCHC-type domain-containing protein n=1 Tax=Leptotrombidium deliense TaxID=299467 RepID=A0A443S3V5_9ACAR|nr:hypothetical protein B4U80_11687 [Leptotrombidium deliense]